MSNPCLDLGHVKHAMVRGTRWGLAPVKGLGACLMRLCRIGPRRRRKESDNEMKKLFATLGVLMVALSILGFVYADWTQTIYIDGTVNTGSYCVGFTDQICEDNEMTLPEPKDIATCTCTLVNQKGTHNGDPVYERIEITIDNGYPQYQCTVDIEISNGGTIPAVIKTVKTVTTPAWWCELTITNTLVGTQLDETDSLWFDLEIAILLESAVGEDCPQDATTTFALEIETIQWNKY
jgi:hypothetical protein